MKGNPIELCMIKIYETSLRKQIRLLFPAKTNNDIDNKSISELDIGTRVGFQQ